jgi:hypothetical protein
MKEQTGRPRYATLLYDVRQKLNVNWAEYVYLDMVHKLSYHGWCFKSLESCAVDLGMTKRGVSKMKERLIGRGLLKRNIKGHLKVTELYTGVAVNSVHQAPHMAVNSVPKSVNSVPQIGELSSTKNNNRITIELGEGYKKAKLKAEEIRAKSRGLAGRKCRLVG